MLAQFRRQASPPTQPGVSVSFDSAPASTSPEPRIVVLNSNRLVGELLRGTLRTVFFGATIALAGSLTDVDDLLSESGVDLLLTDISAADGDAIDRFPSWVVANHGVKRTLVATTHKEPAVLSALMDAPLAGVIDPNVDGIDVFTAACAAVVHGRAFWSESVTTAFRLHDEPSDGIFRLLTPTERMVLGVIGDGCDDSAAAAILPLARNSIRSVRESLHRKLQVQHKGALVARATELGFVLQTADGRIRPGLSQLLRAHGRSAAIMSLPRLQSVA